MSSWAEPEQALDYYDQALKAASTIPGLQLPVMTYLGKSMALVKLERFAEAEQLLNAALAVAEREGALGYQAELLLEQGTIAYQRARHRPGPGTVRPRCRTGARQLVAVAFWRKSPSSSPGSSGRRIDRSMRRKRSKMASPWRGAWPNIFCCRACSHNSRTCDVSRKQYAEAGDLLEEASPAARGAAHERQQPMGAKPCDRRHG